MKIPRLPELAIALTLVAALGSCAKPKHRAAYVLPENTPEWQSSPTPPSAGVEWCREHPLVNCDVVKGIE